MTISVESEIRTLRAALLKEKHVKAYFELNMGFYDEFTELLLVQLNELSQPIPASFICSGQLMQEDLHGRVWNWVMLYELWGIAPPEGLTAAEVNNIQFGYHEWVKSGDLHYDAECPEGVKSFFDLPVYRRHIVQALREKGIATPDVVTDDLVQAPPCPVPNPA